MDEGDIAATTSYGVDYCSAVWHGNIFGVQFHPEKSGATGLMILRNFAELAASK
jgi:glutamine amidotransferase